MGFFDSVSSMLNKGTAAAARTSRSAQLKFQLNDLMRQRRDLTAQLGASLYEAVKGMPELCEGREPLLKGIEDIDAQRTAIEAEIAEIEAEAAAQREASLKYTCPECGTDVSSADLFCRGCGIPIAEVKAAYAAQSEQAEDELTCPVCGAHLEPTDNFCMTCGTKQEPRTAPEPEQDAVAE